MAMNMSSDTLSHVAKFLSSADVNILQCIKDFPLKHIVQCVEFDVDDMRLNPSYWPLIRMVCCRDRTFKFARINQVAKLNDVSLIESAVVDCRIPNVRKLYLAQSDLIEDYDFKQLDKCETLEISNCRKITLTGIRHFKALRNLTIGEMDDIDEKELTTYCELNNIKLEIMKDYYYEQAFNGEDPDEHHDPHEGYIGDILDEDEC
tara:strand:- start:1061 stop:1675 length:615 start_codon:yes stop_codon:yes gene_type:complete